MNWKQAAKMCEDVYGMYVDWEEGFFECPMCGEPIYECDWNNFDLCPVCENNWEDDE